MATLLQPKPMPQDSSGAPWLPISTLMIDNALVDMLLPPRQAGSTGEIVKGTRCSRRFAGQITYWTRISGRLQMIEPVAWRHSDGGPVRTAAAPPQRATDKAAA